MQEVFDRLAKAGRKVVAVGSGIPTDRLLRPDAASEHPDPHIWFDVELWSHCAKAAATALIDADPAGKAFYEKRLVEYQKRLAELHAWAKKRALELPEPRRVLITSHDAFSYFGRAYGFKVVGLQGISTVNEAGGADMVKMVDLIKERGVKAIFVESSVSHQAIDRISKDSGARIGGELFSDAMGTPGQMENGYDLGTYEGMIKHNLNIVVEALK
jgi:manganese/zinc/iron transport system substrate-binding protein